MTTSCESGQPLPEIRQSRWSTRFGMDHFEHTLTEQAQDGFGLLRIVPLDDYSFVAVFQRDGTTSCGDDRANGGDAAASSVTSAEVGQ